MHVKFLETLDWSILIAYFLILIAIGIWASSKRKKESSLFLAENSLKWYHIGFSMWGDECGTFHVDSFRKCRIYYWYCFGELCLVCICLYMSACFCLCSPIFG